MIYICAECKREIKHLRTEGDEVNDCLICPDCSKRVQQDIARQYVELRDQINTFFHSR